jgi:hypothetical protein
MESHITVLPNTRVILTKFWPNRAVLFTKEAVSKVIAKNSEQTSKMADHFMTILWRKLAFNVNDEAIRSTLVAHNFPALSHWTLLDDKEQCFWRVIAKVLNKLLPENSATHRRTMWNLLQDKDGSISGI